MLDQTTGPGGHTELIITKGVKEVCPPSSSSSAEEGKSAGFSVILCIGHTGQSHLSLFKTDRAAESPRTVVRAWRTKFKKSSG